MGRASRARRERSDLATQPWVLDLVREMKSWASLQQFGTMIQATRQAARVHGVDLVELQRTVARVAIEKGLVRPLRQFQSIEEMQAWEASKTPTLPPGSSLN